MTSASLRTGLFALVVVSASSATVACGRAGLDGLDVTDGSIDDDSSIDSGFSDVSFDTGVVFDTTRLDTGVTFDSGFVDSTVVVDSGRDAAIDTGRIDTGRIDTGIIGFDTTPPPDTFIGFDTTPPDTGIEPDTGDIDTGIVFDSGDIDTGDIDTGVIVDGGIDVGPVDGGIICGPGGLTCNPASEICCAGFGTFACTSPGLCIGTPLSCSSAASCKTGEVCCFNGGIGGSASATCGKTCPGIQLCAVSSECRPGTRCLPVFGGYRICR